MTRLGVSGSTISDARSGLGRLAWTLVKIGSTTGLLVFLGWRARGDIQALWQLPLEPSLLIGALLAMMLATALNALRWTLVSKAMG